LTKDVKNYARFDRHRNEASAGALILNEMLGEPQTLRLIVRG